MVLKNLRTAICFLPYLVLFSSSIPPYCCLFLSSKICILISFRERARKKKEEEEKQKEREREKVLIILICLLSCYISFFSCNELISWNQFYKWEFVFWYVYLISFFLFFLIKWSILFLQKKCVI